MIWLFLRAGGCSVCAASAAGSGILAVAFLIVAATAAHAQERWRIDVENGAAISGRNDVRIPGNSGTLFR